MAQDESAARFKASSAPRMRERAPSPPAADGLPHPDEDLGFADRDANAGGTRSRMRREAFLNAVGRLEEVLDLETQMLDQNKPIMLDEFNHRKSHGLLELNRAMAACRTVDRSAFGFEAKEALARLRVKLESNLASLQLHLTAVGEIAAIIARAIENQESDGTYSARRGAQGDLR